MQENYYFSPTSINPSMKTNNKKMDESIEKSYDFCTPWQTNNHLRNV